MKVKVRYMIEKIEEIEITETLIREFYDKFKDELWVRSLIMDEVDDYLREESGYNKNKGLYFDYLAPTEEFIDTIVDKIEGWE